MTRWRQFSLRTFLLIVTLLSLGLARIAEERSHLIVRDRFRPRGARVITY